MRGVELGYELEHVSDVRDSEVRTRRMDFREFGTGVTLWTRDVIGNSTEH